MNATNRLNSHPHRPLKHNDLASFCIPIIRILRIYNNPSCFASHLRRSNSFPTTENISNIHSTDRAKDQSMTAKPKSKNNRLQSTMHRVEELKEYINTHGNAFVPYVHPGGLGKWASMQRHKWQRGRLSTEMFRILSALDFPFDVQEAQWMSRFHSLAQFHSKHGHCNVPHDSTDVPDGLYTWILHQRQLHRQGRLEDERSRRLQGIDFAWYPNEDRWERKFKQLEEFVARHGHAVVPHNWSENPRLAQWTESLRTKWRERDGTRSSLSPSQEARLRKLGFEFEGYTRFEDRIAQLVDIKTRRGHLQGRIPNRGVYSGLRDWSLHQRVLWKENRLEKEREEELRRIGFVFDPPELKWRNDLKEFDAYVEERGFLVSFVHLRMLSSDSLLRSQEKGQSGVLKWYKKTKKTLEKSMNAADDDAYYYYLMKERNDSIAK